MHASLPNVCAPLHNALRRTGCCAALLIALSAAPVAAGGPDARGLYGGGHPVTLSDLPPGPLRKSLERLNPKALRNAEEILSRISFHRNDLASLRASSDGAIYYVCSFTGAGDAGKASLPAGTGAAPVPISSPPLYHSRAGATNVLFLDFNGHVISNTQWNVDYGVSVWNCRAFDTDGDATTFSDAEQQYIREVWQRVAEDYAPFNVDVTTEQPASWNRYTGHALITPTTDASGTACPHNGYGGIAYISVFGGSTYSYNAANAYSPAWVLPMSGGSYANTAEAAAHELGHNMGLSHDGTAAGGLTYYGGHAGSISWGPIMGTGYGQDVSQWCKGEYYDANQFQDDLAIIATRLSYRPDDFGNSVGTASTLPVSGISAAVTGLVETTADADVFTFSTGGGTVSFDAKTYRCANGTWGGNADLVLRLLNNAGTVVASNNPAADTYASISASVAAGIYYLEVKPTGVDTPLSNPPSGYTDYGSLGQYVVTGHVVAVGTNLFITAPNSTATYYTGAVLQVQWSFGLTNAVRVDLLKNGSPFLTLATNSPNDGELLWTIPGTVPPATTYAVRVSDNWNPARFDDSDSRFTIRTPPPTMISESFASTNRPAGWTVSGASAAWEFTSGGYSLHPAASHSEPFNARLYYAAGSDHIVQLITPPFSAAGLTNVTLVFWHAMALWSPDQDTLRVLFRTNAAAGWTTQVYYSTDTPDWTERTVPLPACSTNCAIAFEGNAKYGYGVCIDDVVISAPAAPIPPESSDGDNDGLPDAWEAQNGLSPIVSNAAPSDIDMDGYTDLQEYVADTQPTNGASKLEALTIVGQTSTLFWVQMTPSSTGRLYDLMYTTNLVGGAWQSNRLNRTGNGGPLVIVVTNAPPYRFMRGTVRLP